MGGGADYQAEAYALVAAKILAGEALTWADTGCDRVPIFVCLETGSGGDDLLVRLQKGGQVEIQAKKGLQRGQDLWDALLGLATAITTKANTFGVLLTNSDASGSIREELKNAVERVAANYDITNNLPEIARDFITRLGNANLDPIHVCKRLFIRVWNFEPGSQGEEITLAALRNVVLRQEDAGSASATLVRDGLDLTNLRGGRAATALAKLLGQNALLLSHDAHNLLVVREAYLRWCQDRNSSFIISGTHMALPMESAWAQLRTMDGDKDSLAVSSLAEQIRTYHEWYRLAETNARHHSINVEFAARANRLLVIVAGPGAGKSTLLRRLAWTWSHEDKLLMHASLRKVALALSSGRTFEDALMDASLDSFGIAAAERPRLTQGSTHILADGLDETGEHRAEIAGHLRDWALADGRRHVIVTTRPVGHDPAWFATWAHAELLPLGDSDVKILSDAIFSACTRPKAHQSPYSTEDFLERLQGSRAAHLASRNPMLLGFLISMYRQGFVLGGSRFQLFANVLDQMRTLTRGDRIYRTQMNDAEANRAVDCLGWTLMENPAISERDLVVRLASQLASSFNLNEFQSAKRAREALDFWDERGLIERVGAGAHTTYTFVLLTFQEFTAARYAAGMPDDWVKAWVKTQHKAARYLEVLLLTGGTNKAEVVIEELLAMDEAGNPVSTSGVLAAETLAEMEKVPDDLQHRVVDVLRQRIASPVPLVAYEAGERLARFAAAAPELIGPLASELCTHGQQWTRSIACSLGLLAGRDYVNEAALIDAYPTADDASCDSSRDNGIQIRRKSVLKDLVLLGAEYLLGTESPQAHIDVVKAKFSYAHHSSGVHQELEKMLRARISTAEFEAIPPYWEHEAEHMAELLGGDVEYWRIYYRQQYTLPDFDKFNVAERAAETAFLEALIRATERLMAINPRSTRPASKMGALASVYSVVDIGGSSIQDVHLLRHRPNEAGLIEVLLGAILACELDPRQVQGEAVQVLKRLGTPHYHIYTDIQHTVEFESGRDIVWSCVRAGDLDAKAILEGMLHPARFVCQFAATLTINCLDREAQRSLFGEALFSNSPHLLSVVSSLAKTVWHEEASDALCKRLEQDMTPECAPLVKSLVDLRDGEHADRISAIVHTSLESENEELAEAAITAVKELRLAEAMQEDLKLRYYWWLRDGPRTTQGRLPLPGNIASEMLICLIQIGSVTEDDIYEACNSAFSEVQQVGLNELCSRMDQNEGVAARAFLAMDERRIPIGLLSTLSRSHPMICKTYTDRFLQLLDSDDSAKRLIGIRALGDGWADPDTAIPKLQSVLESDNVRLRDEAVIALRRIARSS